MKSLKKMCTKNMSWGGENAVGPFDGRGWGVGGVMTLSGCWQRAAILLS